VNALARFETRTSAADRPVVSVLDVPSANARLLDVHAPDSPGAWPIVVVLHGMWESRADWDPLARTVAAHGIVVLNIGYRAEEVHRPGAAEDAACAVRFARADGSRFGGDASRITVFGFSAGAVYGALVGLAGDRFTADCARAGVSALPAALVGLAGPYEPGRLEGDPRSELRQSDPRRYALLNPFTHLGANPGLRISLLHGADDTAVPRETATRCLEGLRAAGYDATMSLLPGLGHQVPLPAMAAFHVIVGRIVAITSPPGGGSAR
jgi:acetyl esterase/lipase